jgi:hypothetical protein
MHPYNLVIETYFLFYFSNFLFQGKKSQLYKLVFIFLFYYLEMF